MQEKKRYKDFLGKGWSFPPAFDQDIGNILMEEGMDDIYDSLQILLTTIPGERVMQPRFGCDLRELLFESIDTATVTLIEDKIETAIYYFEARIRPEKVKVDTSELQEGKIIILIDFVVKRTNSRYNFVFPFYKNEGTELLALISKTVESSSSL